MKKEKSVTISKLDLEQVKRFMKQFPLNTHYLTDGIFIRVICTKEKNPFTGEAGEYELRAIIDF